MPDWVLGATRGTLRRSLNMARSTAAERALPLRCVLTCNFRSACAKRQTEHSALVSRWLHNHHPGTLHSVWRQQTSPERRADGLAGLVHAWPVPLKSAPVISDPSMAFRRSGPFKVIQAMLSSRVSSSLLTHPNRMRHGYLPARPTVFLPPHRREKPWHEPKVTRGTWPTVSEPPPPWSPLPGQPRPGVPSR